MLNENQNNFLLCIDNAGCHPDDLLSMFSNIKDLLPSSKYHFSIAAIGLGDHTESQAPLPLFFLEICYFQDG